MSVLGIAGIQRKRRKKSCSGSWSGSGPVLIRRVRDIRSLLFEITRRGESVGFVPTMGALHAGHISLCKLSVEENNYTVASIFVNPRQFAAGEDLDSYPSTFDSDVMLLAEAGVDAVFCPDRKEVYGEGEGCTVEAVNFNDGLREGISRPHFFGGVATVVAKLFNIVAPTRAYFGQKDAAQCVLVKRLVADLNFNIEIKIGDIVREDNGLAMSSRNQYLSDADRVLCGIIYEGLRSGVDVYRSFQGGGDAVHSKEIIKAVEAVYRREGSVISEILYISVDNGDTMKAMEKVERNQPFIISSAVKVGAVRLIDNVTVNF